LISNKDQSKLLDLRTGWILVNKIGEDVFILIVEYVVFIIDLFENFKFDKVVNVGTKF
jgi:hypothetical protein